MDKILDVKKEPKFKLGDKVRIKSSFPYTGSDEVRTITKINSNGTYALNYCEEVDWSDYQLELVPKFKVGDTVRIKDDIIAGRLIDNITVAKGMIKYCSSITEVTGIVHECSKPIGYLLAIDDGNFTWTDSMLDKFILNRNDNVGVSSKQEHYKKASMQPVQFMQSLMTYEQFEGFLLGQIIKYMCRKDYKNQKESDINKARQYAYWLKLHKEGHIIDPIKDSVPNDFEYKGI